MRQNTEYLYDRDELRKQITHAQCPKVLFLGENWYGSCARAQCMALRRLGCEVMDIDIQTLFPQVRRRSLRALMRLLRGRLVRDYNDLILDTASSLRPDFLLASKGPFVEAETLRILRCMGIKLYNYYPDPSLFAYNEVFVDSLSEYDCLFYTKINWRGKAFLDRLQKSVFVAHGYDPEIHAPVFLGERERREYGHDVVVIAMHTPNKEKVLDELVSRMPTLDLAIWGNYWKERCRSSRLSSYIKGYALTGLSYATAICTAKVNLAIMSSHSFGLEDQTTTRTYEIPACGGFMLHERSPELLTLFIEDQEVACFESPEELVAKVTLYLSDAPARNAIAMAGYRRCVPAYAYDNRMAEILSWHLNSQTSKDVEAADFRSWPETNRRWLSSVMAPYWLRLESRMFNFWISRAGRRSSGI
jgi:spore maturation protein CgeB